FIALNTNLVFSVNGARPSESAYTLDGGLNMDMYNNVPAAFPDPDSLQEFSMLQNSYSAVNGRNVGVVVNMITKSGTNNLHGTLYEFLRNDFFDARNFFSAGVNPLRRNQFGGGIGGPCQAAALQRQGPHLLLCEHRCYPSDSRRHHLEYPRAQRGRAHRR